MELDISEEEEVFRALSTGSKFTPANLNPSQSGPTLVKITEGKYPSAEEKQLEAVQAIENVEQVGKSEVSSQPQRKKQQKSTASRAAPQENNLFRKMDQLDPSQVVKLGLDPSVVHQENNLNRK